jgi:hypothetical protein
VQCHFHSASPCWYNWFFFLWFYIPFTLFIAPLRIIIHSFLSQAFSLHIFISRVFISASTSSKHISLGLPIPCLPPSLVFYIIFAIRVYSILMTCPSHSSLLILISVTISGDLYAFCSSRLLLILHTPYLHFGP